MSTTKAEEEIDLGEVHAQLMDIDKRIDKARKTHNSFLKELGLKEI